MKCKDVMTKNPAYCVPEDSAVKAAQMMRDQNIGPVPVVESRQSKKVEGMVTDRDLAIKVVAAGRDPNTCTVADVMTRNVVTCRTSDDLNVAVEAMQDRQLRRIVVVDEQGNLAGIIAQADIATRAQDAQRTAETVEEISRPNVMRAG
jgi:CBS domain-containing protein